MSILNLASGNADKDRELLAQPVFGRQADVGIRTSIEFVFIITLWHLENVKIGIVIPRVKS
jgi:hypothetical protein